jgi:hypothetical protein
LPFSFALLGRALRLTVTPGRFHPKHALITVLIMLLFGVFLLFVLVARMLDALLVPGWRRVEVKAPLYIVANPRSGTTYLHRLLALDGQFTHFKLWHTILPSVLLYRLVAGVAGLDRLVGGPFKWLLGRINKIFFGGWEGIHNTGFERTEEDVMLFLYTLYNPAFSILIPWIDDLPEAVFLDDQDPQVIGKVARYYRTCLQRHVHATRNATGGTRTLLNKNVLLGGQMKAVLDAAPDVRLVYLARHPYQSVASMLDMFGLPWFAFHPGIRPDGPEMRAMAEMCFEYLRRWERICDAMPPEQVLRIRYDDLVADPEATVQKVYAHFGLELGAEYAVALAEAVEAGRRYASEHEYSLERFGLTPADVQLAVPEVFDRWQFAR